MIYNNKFIIIFTLLLSLRYSHLVYSFLSAINTVENNQGQPESTPARSNNNTLNKQMKLPYTIEKNELYIAPLAESFLNFLCSYLYKNQGQKVSIGTCDTLE